MRDEIDNYKKNTTYYLELVQLQVIIRINEQFKKDNIRSMVELKARERIDVVADSIIHSQIEKQIEPIHKKYNIRPDLSWPSVKLWTSPPWSQVRTMSLKPANTYLYGSFKPVKIPAGFLPTEKISRIYLVLAYMVKQSI